MRSTSVLVLTLIGTICIEYTWDGIVLSAIESYPTSLRATAIASCSLASRFGAIFSPTLAHLGTVWHPSPFLAISIASTLSLILSILFLPETKGTDLDKVKLMTMHTIDNEMSSTNNRRQLATVDANQSSNNNVTTQIPLINMKSIE